MDFCDDMDQYYATRSEACEQCTDGNWGFYIFFFASFIPITALFSAWLVAKFVYEPHLKLLESLPEPEEKPIEPPYEEKYPLEKATSDNKDLNPKICHVCEMTPEGNVILRYNKENEGFEYWSDKKDVAYKYLETVARKYVTVFCCAELYIDRDKDIQDQIEKEEEEKKMKEEKEKMAKEDKEETEDSDDDVFAKLKPPAEKRKQSKKSNIRAAINANKYRYIGKLKEFADSMKKEKPVVPKKKIGFGDWKSMFG